MAFFSKKTKKHYEDQISLLTHRIEELTQIVKTQELLNLRAENQRLKEIERLISNVHFSLKSVSYLSEEQQLLLKYDIQNVLVPIDDEGNVGKNDMFFAINKLRLISFEDMKKIQSVINKVKKV